MTLIEFFTRDSIENLCAALTTVPDRIVLIGDKTKVIDKYIKKYSEIFIQRGYNVEMIPRAVNRNNVNSIVDTLSDIVNTYDDCCFGLTGGEDLYLYAMGIVFERYKDKNLQLHWFNIRNSRIVDCDLDGKTIFENALPILSVRENILAYGGDIIYGSVKEGGTINWDLSEDFLSDINAMWRLCRSAPKKWNIRLGVMASFLGDEDSENMSFSAPVSALKSSFNDLEKEYKEFLVFMKKLSFLGVITDYNQDFATLSFKYKNKQVKSCLTKAGLILELKIYTEALKVKDKNGNPVYNDAVNGVCIDWDGKIHNDKDSHDTENEIDVMLMHGMVPVFISCKNGGIEDVELYKLSSVADRFGGRYAKKILVASDLGKTSHKALYIRQRAIDMNILIFDDVCKLDDETLREKISGWWLNG